jgi:hypothetical protein
MQLEYECIILNVHDELKRAMKLHPPMNSAHEAYAVILEELDEFWEEVRKKTEARDKSRIRQELIQIAAMACRTIIDLDL